MPKLTPVLVTLRASAALAAAGAWDATPTEAFVEDAKAITLFFSYTRGGAAGSARLQVEMSPYSAAVAGVENWFRASVKNVGAFAAGADTNSGIQRENGVLYTAVGAAIENVLYGSLTLDRSVQRIRVNAQEVGNVGAPGTLHIVAYMGVEE